MNIQRFIKKLGAVFALAVGVYKGADACAPAPALTPVFNNNAALADSAIPNQYRRNQLKEPTAEEAKTLWRVRVGAWEIGAGGYHTFLEFAPYSDNDPARVKNKDIYQIHGIACDEVRRTWAEMNPGKKVSYDQYLHGDYVLKAMGAVKSGCAISHAIDTCVWFAPNSAATSSSAFRMRQPRSLK